MSLLTEHEGAVTAVDVSGDGLKVLTGTSSVRVSVTCSVHAITLLHTQGNIGILDAGSRSYSTVMRSHTGQVQCMSLSGSGRELVTCSSDHTIRVWDLMAMEQVIMRHIVPLLNLMLVSSDVSPMSRNTFPASNWSLPPPSCITSKLKQR